MYVYHRSQSPRAPQSPQHQVKEYAQHDAQRDAHETLAAAVCSSMSEFQCSKALPVEASARGVHGSSWEPAKHIQADVAPAAAALVLNKPWNIQVEDNAAELAALGLPMGFGKHTVSNPASGSSLQVCIASLCPHAQPF